METDPIARIAELEQENARLQREVAFIDDLRNRFRDRNPEGKTILDFLSCWEEQATCRAHRAETRIKELETQLKSSYRQGVIDGIQRYAWWRDGVEMVGTCGKTLKEAIAQLDMELNHVGR